MKTELSPNPAASRNPALSSPADRDSRAFRLPAVERKTISLSDDLISAVYFGEETLTFRIGEKYRGVTPGPYQFKTGSNVLIDIEVDAPAREVRIGDLTAEEIRRNGYPMPSNPSAADLRAGRISTFISAIHWYGAAFPEIGATAIENTRQALKKSRFKTSAKLLSVVRDVRLKPNDRACWEALVPVIERESPESFRFGDTKIFAVSFKSPELAPVLRALAAKIKERVTEQFGAQKLRCYAEYPLYFPPDERDPRDTIAIAIRAETDFAERRLHDPKISKPLFQAISGLFRGITPELKLYKGDDSPVSPTYLTVSGSIHEMAGAI